MTLISLSTNSEISLTGIMLENYITFNVNRHVEVAGLTNKDGKEACKNIQLRFIGTCRFIASSLSKLHIIYVMQV